MEPDAHETLTCPIANVYRNWLLMEQIIGNVEHFADRDSLELASKHLRAISLSTPINRRQERYKIFLEYDVKPRIHTSERSLSCGHSEMHFYICPNTEQLDEEEIRVMNVKKKQKTPAENAAFTNAFLEKVLKRMPKQIVAVEVKNRLITGTMWSHLEKMPKLKNFTCVFNDPDDDEEGFADNYLPDPEYIASQVEFLTLDITTTDTDKIQYVKSMIGPGLKHFRCWVAPATNKFQWFNDELMEELKLHNVQLDTCQVYFIPSFPNRDIVTLTQFLSERSDVFNFRLKRCCSSLEVKRELIPEVVMKHGGENEGMLSALLEACPVIFRKAEKLKLFDISPDDMLPLVKTLGICYTAKDILLASAVKDKKDSFAADVALEALPTSLESLTLYYFKFTAESVKTMSQRVSKTLRRLEMWQNSNFATVKNFTDLLKDLPELRDFDIDMEISPLLFPQIVAHQNLEKFKAKPTEKPSEKAFQVLLSAFETVDVSCKIRNRPSRMPSRKHPRLVLSNRRQSPLEQPL